MATFRLRTLHQDTIRLECRLIDAATQRPRASELADPLGSDVRLVATDASDWINSPHRITT